MPLLKFLQAHFWDYDTFVKGFSKQKQQGNDKGTAHFNPQSVGAILQDDMFFSYNYLQLSIGFSAQDCELSGKLSMSQCEPERRRDMAEGTFGLEEMFP